MNSIERSETYKAYRGLNKTSLEISVEDQEDPKSVLNLTNLQKKMRSSYSKDGKLQIKVNKHRFEEYK